MYRLSAVMSRSPVLSEIENSDVEGRNESCRRVTVKSGKVLIKQRDGV